jgi:hypothetical protein
VDSFEEFQKLQIYSALEHRPRPGTGEIEIKVGEQWRLPEEIELEILCACKATLNNIYPDDPDTENVAITVPRKFTI